MKFVVMAKTTGKITRLLEQSGLQATAQCCSTPGVFQALGQVISDPIAEAGFPEAGTVFQPKKLK